MLWQRRGARSETWGTFGHILGQVHDEIAEPEKTRKTHGDINRGYTQCPSSERLRVDDTLIADRG